MIAGESPVAAGAPAADGAPAPMLIDHSAPAPEAPAQTVLLPDSEGVVSIADQGGSVPASAPAAAPAATPNEVGDTTSATEAPPGATPLFWIICLLTGLGVGVLAYLVVLKLGN
jgi:hypothetical protein